MKRRKRNKLEVPFKFQYTKRMKNKEEIENAINVIFQNIQKLQALWEKNKVGEWIDHTIENENDESIPVEDVDLAYSLGSFGQNLCDYGKEFGGE
jgi:hypothetical protein